MINQDETDSRPDSIHLDNVERFALQHLFDFDISDEAMKGVSFTVQERSVTAAGFFSIIKFDQPLEHIPSLQEVSKSFTHPRLKKGGMFVCWIDQDFTLCLEGVAEKKNWPKELIPIDLLVSSNT